MKCVCITTREDVLTGMRLAGIEGSLVVGREDALHSLNTVKANKEVALVLMCPETCALLQEEVEEMKLHGSRPLLLEIPAPDEKKR